MSQQHYQLGYERKQIHGMDPQLLIEKIMRERIYQSVYWKDLLFAATAETIVDRGSELAAIGGIYGTQKVTPFISCVLKLLQLQPELEIILLYINQSEKYLTALGAFYLRLVGTPSEIYQYLEPLLLDNRKLRKQISDGSYILTYMDEFVDDLLRNDRVCDTILPRIPKRFVLEDAGELLPRISPLEQEIEEVQSEHQSSEEEIIQPEITVSVDDLTTRKKHSKKKVKQLFKKEKKKKVIEEQQQEEEEKRTNSGFKDISLNFHETNILRANLGLKPLK